MASSPSSAAPRWDARTWSLLVVLCGVLFLDGLDVSMVGMALPSISSELGLTTSQLQWVVSGYVLGYGGLLLLGGRAADLLGRRRVLLIGLSVFVVASAIGGLVNDGTLLVITRVVKGMSAAFTAPAGLSIITTTFAEGPNRNRALAYYTATGASGFSLGLVLGGLLTELGWRWTFLLPVPFALAILFLARRVIPRDRIIPGERAALRHRRRVHHHRRHAAARAHRGGGARGRMERSGDRRLVRPRGGAAASRSWRSSCARRSRSSGSASCAPARWCAPTSAWRRCSAPTSASSSSARSTCRPCTAGRRSRPLWRSCRAASWSRSGRRGSARWSTASARRG